MAINPDIRDRAYEFFIAEAPELLQELEANLLTLRAERSTPKVHALMRTAHSLKGGSASVGLEAIAMLAHRLETIFKALYSETLEIDTDLESQLLQAYDCLYLPVIEQITAGELDTEQALATAAPIFAQIEERLGDALTQTESYIPSSAELGIDMTVSIFEVDVTEGLERLATVVAHPQEYQVAGELRAQAQVFAGFAELLNLPGFAAIAQTAQRALDAHPNRALEITQLALADFHAGQQAVLAGDLIQGGSPSEALVALADRSATEFVSPDYSRIADSDESLLSLEDVFGNGAAIAEMDIEAYPELAEPATLYQNAEPEPELEETFSISLEEIFGNGVETPEFMSLGTDTTNPLAIIEGELVADSLSVTEAAVQEGQRLLGINEPRDYAKRTAKSDRLLAPASPESLSDTDTPETLEAAVHSIEQLFNELPAIQDTATLTSLPNLTHSPTAPKPSKSRHQRDASGKEPNRVKASSTSNFSVRVNLDRLERMNNKVGELAINRNGLALQNEQLQRTVRELLNRFSRFQNLVGDIRELSDQMLVARPSSNYGILPTLADFDSLEMDSYGVLHSQLQELLEETVQLEEAVDDITLFAKVSDQTIEQQRQMLTHLRDELMWARMLPLGEVLRRFPRVLRDLSATYHKPVSLKLSGTSVLVDKAVLEKLYDPLLHLLRNAFDHGIEPPEVRVQQGKPEQGQIEIRAYHKGSQTFIEIRDDGQGLDRERIARKAIDKGLLSVQKLAGISDERLYDFIFEPGFSTASQVSEISGRGVGLDVVRLQLRQLKGTIAVTSSPGQGTTFTLRLPLTLTITKLLVCFVGSTALALPSDSIEEIIIPTAARLKQSGTRQFLHWREELVPTYRLAELLEYACPLLETSASKALLAVPSPKDWALPLLVLRREQQVIALEVDRLVTEQELVIKPFGAAIAAPSYTYGCTILGDGSLIPVMDGAVLLDRLLDRSTTVSNTGSQSTLNVRQNSPMYPTRMGIKTAQTPTVLVIDDAATLRRTLALTLEGAGFRVLQARDGWEALEQLQQSSSVQLMVCDVEMPNMNGFEFLSQRRQNPQFSKIPVVMLTSRSNDKHRALAMQLGATAYFIKPYIEQEFIRAIKDIITSKKSVSEAKPSPV
ncbi:MULTISPECIES: hybrid sensor histidine kinase/response regulator [unclassified Coleofasciculus]|uniref:hybrid sensor histidine kinase/response regulator n=1 Tax=unclassified Coleofasciculus TaxID=2692782 RepID=UPI001881FBEC|nr:MULTISPECIES: hybrid sensor histidine kinase/response regulator [unclassified Coleofasciculus]MBE9126721.1 hybrid sensor histidine kinase/response regulator [Coleofasciculus sp. LEGE 07081]MBE9150081.1 hybrid sensor histidine kinase/response regulator [Coleofasciculus sp. LEGE 07092]